MKYFHHITALSLLITSSSVFANQAPAPVRTLPVDGKNHALVVSKGLPTALPQVDVYKSPSCGCCQKWVEHLQDNGFKVKNYNVDNLYPYKQQAKLGPAMGSCHTAFVEGYAIEGHVPASDIKKLLQQKPAITGLTLPAMPLGSPGMEAPGRPAQPFTVMQYKDGAYVGVFSKHPQ